VLLALILLPLAAAAVVWSVPSARLRYALLPVTAILHLALVLAAFAQKGLHPAAGDLLGFDALGAWIQLVISVLGVILAWYAPAFLSLPPERNHRLFSTCFLAFLGLAPIVTLGRHPGLVWVGIEATTLIAAPLVYFSRNQRSLEAAWKFLVIGSVGVALAFLGTLFIAYGAFLGGLGEPLTYTKLVDGAALLSRPWLRGGFVLVLVGYGTKMGLAPMHTWKPDAYGESPGLVGALLASGVTSCAYLALLRLYAVVCAAGEGAFARDLLVAFGLLSMAWAVAFMLRQNDFKRLLAYSSVEHMGILAFGVGLGGDGVRWALFHAAANMLVKTTLFLGSGNLQRAYGSKLVPSVSGALRRLPLTAWLFLVAFLAITGLPPFATFASEFGILQAALASGRPWLAGLYLLMLGAIFVGFSSTVVEMLQGTPNPRRVRTPYRDTRGLTLPLAAALGLALVLGLHVPAALGRLWTDAARIVEGGR